MPNMTPAARIARICVLKSPALLGRSVVALIAAAATVWVQPSIRYTTPGLQVCSHAIGQGRTWHV